MVSAGVDTVVRLTEASNDPELGTQWGLGPAPGVNAFAAWDVTTGGSVVAVIDVSWAISNIIAGLIC